jgi:hypothetical protein
MNSEPRNRTTVPLPKTDDPASSIEEPDIGSSNERARVDAIAAEGERLPR